MRLGLTSVALAAALFWGAAGTAKAVTVTMNPGDTNPLDAVVTGTVYNSILLKTGLSFTDDYFFTLDNPPVSALTTSVALNQQPGATNFGIANLVAKWFLPNGTQLGSALDVTDSSGNVLASAAAGLTLAYTVAAPLLSGLHYTLEMTGNPLSNGGDYNVAVQVPGPIVGAGLPGLLAACGGLLGWARRRRRQQVA
jgi:hypothetical protein